jgi:hypothetical protein
MAGGRWVVRQRRHWAEDAILRDYRTAMASLVPQLG